MSKKDKKSYTILNIKKMPYHRTRARATLLSLLGIITVLGQVSTAGPAASPPSGRHRIEARAVLSESIPIRITLPPDFIDTVLFQSDADGDNDLYYLSGRGLEKLTEDSIEQNYALFSPDGQSILFEVVENEATIIYRMDLKTRRQERLIALDGNATQPCWTPDGKKCVFTTDIWKGQELAEFDLRDGRLTRLTDTSGDNILPAVSPDGRWIAFTGKRIAGWRVYTLDRQTDDIDQIAGWGSCRPDWSPDGTWLAYVAGRRGSLHDIYLMKPDGSDKHSVSQDPEHSDYFPSWSRDGKRIYFSKKIEGRYQICVLDRQSGKTFQITHGPASCERPDIY